MTRVKPGSSRYCVLLDVSRLEWDRRKRGGGTIKLPFNICFNTVKGAKECEIFIIACFSRYCV